MALSDMAIRRARATGCDYTLADMQGLALVIMRGRWWLEAPARWRGR